MQDVEDVLQEGLYKFLNTYNKNGFELEGKLECYIFTICKNCWLKELERKKKLKLSEAYIVEEIEDAKWALIEKQRKEVLLDIIERKRELLSNKCQKVFDFRRDGLTCKEIAELLHLKNSQMVKDKHYRCKERLRELVKQDQAYLDFINDE
jgi:RNA polymerase sigma factor (sigma-70 family)